MLLARKLRPSWVFTGVFIISVALRAVEVLCGNYLFGFDHGRDYLAAYSIVENHKLTLIGAEVGAGSAGLSGLFHGPGFFYLIALVYKIFSGDPYGGLLLMFLFGVGSVLLAYLLGSTLWGKRGGLATMFLLGISPLIVPQSRFIWNHHPTTFFILLIFYFIYRVKDNVRVFLPLAVFTSAFIYNFELAISVPILVTIFFWIFFIYRVREFLPVLLSILAVLAGYLPMFLFELRHGFMAFRGLIAYVSADHGQAISVSRIADHGLSYLNNLQNTFVFGFIPDAGRYFLLALISVVTVCYLLVLKDQWQKKFFGFLACLIIISWGLFLLLNNTIWDYYLIHLHVVYVLFFAFVSIRLLRSSVKSALMRLLICIFIFFYVAMIWGTAFRLYLDYRFDYFDLGQVEKIRGKRLVIDFIYNDSGGQNFNALIFMPPIYTYPYEYLFKTYAKKKYGYQPGGEKKGLVYLIIEPDRDKPWRHKGWLETVVSGGRTLNTWKLKTGHIVEKRIYE